MYYLTFLNRKIKYYYLFTYCLLHYYYYILYVSYYIIYLIIYRERNKASRRGKSKGTNRAGRERTRAKDAADIFASSSLPFRSVCCPHRPPRPVLGEAIATTSPHLATDRQAANKKAGQRLGLSGILPASSSSSSPPSGGEGRAASQPGRAIPSRSPCRPSPPCRGASAYWRTPPEVWRAMGQHIRAADAIP